MFHKASIKEYLYAKNDNNFAGLSYIRYGNYQFTVQVATEDADTEPLLTHVYNTMGYTASNKDEIAVSRVYAKYEIQGNTTYMELTYILNRDGEVQFITFKALPEPNTYYDSTYHYMSCYQYVNVGTAKCVQHLTSTSYVYDTDSDLLTKFYQYNCTFYDNGFGQGHTYSDTIYASGVEVQTGEYLTNEGVSTIGEYTHNYDEVLMENSPINGVCNFNDYFYEHVYEMYN